METKQASMTPEEIYKDIAANRPILIYVSGKTSTGKTTLANKLAADFGYTIIELDRIVVSAVKDRYDIEDQETVFLEVYRGRKELEWVHAFVEGARKEIDGCIQANKPVIVEGAIANPLTLHELVDGYESFMFIYLHPKDLALYAQKLTSRFMLTNEEDHAGLPSRFWEQIKPEDFKKFCVDRIVTPSIKQAIENYASLSQVESETRLASFKQEFKAIKVVEV